MMSLRSQLSTHMPQPRCAIAGMLKDAEGQAQEILELLNDPTVSSSALGRLLRANGYDIGNHSLTRHRRRECTCVNA